jgi:hypothetical protein
VAAENVGRDESHTEALARECSLHFYQIPASDK